jgi:hypothetical protein
MWHHAERKKREEEKKTGNDVGRALNIQTVE